MSFEQGLSGLSAASSSLSAIGNNVANANTVGFKQSSAQFADMFAASLAGASSVSIGTGVTVSNVAQQFTQGNITTTTNPLDTAISGPGFFQLSNTAGATVYSRNGQFHMDKSGFMVNAQGDKVNGYMPNAAGVILGGAPVPLQINPANIQPQASATSVVGVNLSSASAVPTTSTFSSTDPTSYTNSTSMTVYDSLGASHVATVYFARQPIAAASLGNASVATTGVMTLSGSTTGLSVGNTVTVGGVTYTITGVTGGTTLTVTPAPTSAVAAAPATTNAPSANWNTYLTVDGNPIPAAGTPLTQLTFNSLGALASTTPASTPLGSITSSALFPNSTSVSTTQAITFDFNSPTAGTTQYGSPFAVNTLTQDGYASGQLNSTSTSQDGTIMGRYSNGQTRSLGQIVLANFTGVQGLQDIGNNSWVQTAASGNPLVGPPGSGGLGTLQSSATEDSNVDLTAALVNMITAQRVYQANAQTIKTEDTLMQTVVNLR
jgi:flagellar hook protein FlgE